MPREWSINGRFFTQRITGVQRYAREIVAALDELLALGHPQAEDLQLTAVVPSSCSGDIPVFRKIKVRRAGRLRGHAWEQIELPAHARGGLLSLCNTGPLVRRRQVICIHDLNPIIFPASYSRPFRAAYATLLPVLGRRSARVATVSRFSARLLLDRGITRQAPLIAGNGHEHVQRWGAVDLPGASDRPPNKVVVLGSLARHKNVSAVLDLAPRLAQQGIEVAVVGRTDHRVFAGRSCGREEMSGIRWLGPLTDEQLAQLLRGALCLAFPSLIEGFGLPPLEAMALGCPVVVSDRASLPEVCGDAALYASPSDPEQWMNCFLNLRQNPGLRASMAEKGRTRAAQFSWKASAELYLQALAELDSPRRAAQDF